MPLTDDEFYKEGKPEAYTELISDLQSEEETVQLEFDFDMDFDDEDDEDE